MEHVFNAANFLKNKIMCNSFASVTYHWVVTATGLARWRLLMYDMKMIGSAVVQCPRWYTLLLHVLQNASLEHSSFKVKSFQASNMLAPARECVLRTAKYLNPQILAQEKPLLM